MRWVWKDGRLYPENEALVSVCDGAVLHGASLFETLRCYRGQPFLLEQHLQRLQRWLGRLHLFARARETVDLSPDTLRTAIGELLEANGLLLSDARLRITVTAGADAHRPSCFLLADGITPEQIARWEQGIRAILLPDPRAASGELPKWGSYAWHMEAQWQAQARGADEAIWFNRDGYLTEGAVSNLFVLQGNRLLTPPLDEGILAGVTRAVVLQLAEELGVECREERIPVSALQAAEAVLLTNSVREITHVIRLEDELLPQHSTVKHLQEAYRRVVHRQIQRSQ